ncbi:MAG: mandelate racemase/muconate lactonizing enzyme family protein, partial [Thaumarchaeota archaeon]|nr:mandelate racemase/muconate lactonizing enzyme family protein [Nitrososphaerota archaeon]
MGLKITDIRTATVVGNYYWTFVRIYSHENSGTGEGFFAPRLADVIKEFGRVIIGEDALDIRNIVEKLKWAALPSGRSGINAHAISAIEIALLDLVSKHLNCPMNTLLGGKLRDKVRVYADMHSGKSLESMDEVLLPTRPKWAENYSRGNGVIRRTPMHGRAGAQKFGEEYTPEAYSKRGKQMISDGYTALKFDLDVPTPYLQKHTMISGSLTNKEIGFLSGLVSAVRNTVGDEVDLLFDLHWRFDLESSIRLARALEPYNLMWLEDPLPPGNPNVYGRIVSSTSTPIATGENLYSRLEFSQIFDTGIGIVTPDGLKMGGLLETKFVSEMGALQEVSISPHNIGSPIGTMAQAHLSASLPNFGVLEIHGHDVPIWSRLAKKMAIKNGFIELNDEPGLGVEL